MLVQSQPVIEHSGELLLGSRIFAVGINGKELVGAVTNKFVDGKTNRQYYPIGGAMFADYFHFSKIMEFRVKRKSKLISYADKEFNNKRELVAFLHSSPLVSGRVAILYHTQINDGIPSACQLVVSEDSRNIASIHFRRPAINRYLVRSSEAILANLEF